MKFCTALEAEQPDTFIEVLNIAVNRDNYERVPEDMDEYGKQVLRRAGADDEVIDTIDGYTDFTRLGEDLWGPRRNPAQRFRWGEEPQRNEGALAAGQSEGYGACGDDGVRRTEFGLMRRLSSPFSLGRKWGP